MPGAPGDRCARRPSGKETAISLEANFGSCINRELPEEGLGEGPPRPSPTEKAGSGGDGAPTPRPQLFSAQPLYFFRKFRRATHRPKIEQTDPTNVITSFKLAKKMM